VDGKLREAAVAAFNKNWQEAFDAGVELERCFRRLCDTMDSLAGAGAHVHLEFPDPLQAWWVAYRETRGDFIPERNPVEAPV
jgi:hypothetical protein